MPAPHPALTPSSPASNAPRPERFQGLPVSLLLTLGGISLAFVLPLMSWVRFGLQNDLFSYTLLVPVVSLYLFITGARMDGRRPGGSLSLLSVAFAVAGLTALGAYGLAQLNGTEFVTQDSVAITTLSFVLLVAAASIFLLPRPMLRRATFPLVFLVFMVPLPVAVEHAVETLLQLGSAPPAYWLLKLSGTPVFRQDLIFQLPGITLQVAPECSGIRSTIVLFLTSMVAGQLFLRSPWKRAILIGAVLPLALVRNGFRIFVIGELCVRMGPHMIDSFVHKKGGPIFFALSLIPFSILVYFLVKSDRRKSVPSNPQS